MQRYVQNSMLELLKYLMFQIPNASNQCAVYIIASSLQSEILWIFVFFIFANRYYTNTMQNVHAYVCAILSIYSDTFLHIYVYMVFMWILYVKFIWGEEIVIHV